MTAEERRISAVVIAQDEAERLEACVRSCMACADEVLVVDGGSTDGTRDLAAGLGCTVVENPWPGYGVQRNFGADRAQHDWVLWVDADEVVGGELAAEILAFKRTTTDTEALTVRRVGDFMGGWIEGAEERHHRLYDRRACRVTEVAVHEAVDVSGRTTGELAGTIWHYGFRSLSDHVRRFDRYTTLEARTAHEAGRRFSLARLLLRPPARLAKVLLSQRLYRHGVRGLAVAVAWAHYESMRELKLRELELGGRPHQAIPEEGT